MENRSLAFAFGNMVNKIARNSRTNGKRRRVVAAMATLSVVISVAALFALRRIEISITFHPERMSDTHAVPAAAAAERVWLTVRSGQRLNGLFIRARRQPAVRGVIYFHGNTGNLSNVVWIGEALATRDLDVLLIDYRGYGASDGDVGGEDALYEDGDAAYDYMVRDRGVRPERVALYGQSLGTTVAIDVASRRTCAALVIESGLSSASDMARHVMPWLPGWLHWLGRYRFESARKLRAVHCPVLVTHGSDDRTIPVEQARTLYSAANEPKKLVIMPGADHNVAGSAGIDYIDLVRDFVASR